jgi:hypothetical protein
MLPCVSNLNELEEFFCRGQRIYQTNWAYFEDDPSQGFDSFLEWCIKAISTNEESARGHFQHAGIQIGFCGN